MSSPASPVPLASVEDQAIELNELILYTQAGDVSLRALAEKITNCDREVLENLIVNYCSKESEFGEQRLKQILQAILLHKTLNPSLCLRLLGALNDGLQTSKGMEETDETFVARFKGVVAEESAELESAAKLQMAELDKEAGEDDLMHNNSTVASSAPVVTATALPKTMQTEFKFMDGNVVSIELDLEALAQAQIENQLYQEIQTQFLSDPSANKYVPDGTTLKFISSGISLEKNPELIFNGGETIFVMATTKVVTAEVPAPTAAIAARAPKVRAATLTFQDSSQAKLEFDLDQLEAAQRTSEDALLAELTRQLASNDRIAEIQESGQLVLVDARGQNLLNNPALIFADKAAALELEAYNNAAVGTRLKAVRALKGSNKQSTK